VRLLHLSDLHLGFRQFQRTTPTGINQREWDVAQSFTRAIDRVIELRPDIVLIAGDVFHTVRPTNPAILHAFAQFSRLMRELPDAIVVVVAGNHDMPRSSETLCILRLFTPLGIHVVDSEPRRLTFPERGLSILAVPDLPPGTVAIEPDPMARLNVLVMHGEVEGAMPEFDSHSERAALKIPAAVVSSPAWDYVALGDIHVYQKVGPKAFYSGALDYTSTNVWGEKEEEAAEKLPGKGMIERDLESGKQTFHRLPVTREFLDLPPIKGRGLSAADLDAAIAAAVARGGIDGKVVRLVARDVPRHIAREIDHKVLREFQRRALHFHLDTRRPEVQRTSVSGGPGRRPSLAEMLRESLRNRVLTSDIDRDRLVELGAHYLREAEQAGTVRDLTASAEET
jgi:DNA repair exonuclease SbcCD nuclease subunit